MTPVGSYSAFAVIEGGLLFLALGGPTNGGRFACNLETAESAFIVANLVCHAEAAHGLFYITKQAYRAEQEAMNAY
jgi:hypothetical protein